MKHSSWGFGLILLSVLCASPAFAEVSYYFEGGVGYASTGDFRSTMNDGYPFPGTWTVTTANNDTYTVDAPKLSTDKYNVGGNLIVGMKLNSLISVEMMYLKYRDFSAQNSVDTVGVALNSSSTTLVGLDSLGVKGSMDASAFGVGLRLDKSLSDRYSLFARAHVMEWHQNVEYSGELIKAVTRSTGTAYDIIRYDSDRSGFAPYVGAGLSFKYSNNSSLYLEVNDTEIGKDTFKVNVMGVFFGFHYDFANKGFGASQTANEKRSEANGSRAITACDPQYKDVSGLACQ